VLIKKKLGHFQFAAFLGTNSWPAATCASALQFFRLVLGHGGIDFFGKRFLSVILSRFSENPMN